MTCVRRSRLRKGKSKVMSDFNFREYCINKLLEQVPEIREIRTSYGKTLEDLEDWVTIIYEDLLCEYVLSLIHRDNLKEKDVLKRAFDLIEELARHENFDVRCVAQVGFLEKFVANLEPTSGIEKYLKFRPHALELAREIANLCFGLDPHTWEKRDKD